MQTYMHTHIHIHPTHSTDTHITFTRTYTHTTLTHTYTHIHAHKTFTHTCTHNIHTYIHTHNIRTHLHRQHSHTHTHIIFTHTHKLLTQAKQTQRKYMHISPLSEHTHKTYTHTHLRLKSKHTHTHIQIHTHIHTYTQVSKQTNKITSQHIYTSKFLTSRGPSEMQLPSSNTEKVRPPIPWSNRRLCTERRRICLVAHECYQLVRHKSTGIVVLRR
jgi:hypothetical protein